MFNYVPDGTYDNCDLLTRYVIYNGRPLTVISKAWLDAGGPTPDVDEKLKLPWGSYPDMPKKVKK